MDENKDRVVSVSESIVTESTTTTTTTTTTTEHVAGEDLSFQGQIDGAFDSCNGDDLMVEVLGSEVYVGGVCTSGSGENLDDDDNVGRSVSVDAEVGSERPVSIGRDGGAVDGLDLWDAGVSGGEAVNQGTGAGNEASLGVSEPVEEKGEVVGGVVMGDENLEVVVVEDRERESQVVSGGDEVQDVENRGTGGETEANSVAEEKGVQGEMRGVGESTGKDVVLGGSDASEEVSKQEVEALGEKVGDPVIKSGIEGSSVDSKGVESQVVEEVDVMESAEIRSGLATEAVEQEKKAVGDGTDAVNGLETHEVGLPDGVQNHGIETMVTDSATVDNSSAEPQVNEGKYVVISSKVAVVEADTTGENFSCLVEKQQVKIEVDGGSENHSNVNAESESLGQLTQMVVENEVTITDYEVVLDSEQDESLKPEQYYESNMGQEMEVDIKVQDAEQVDTGVRQEVFVSNNEVPGPTEHLKSEDHLENSVASDVSPVCADAVQEMQVEEKIAEAQQVGLDEGQQIEVEKQQGASEKLGSLTENEGHVYGDTTYSHQHTVVGAEGTPASDNVPYSSEEGVLPLSSVNDETQALENVDIAPMDTEEVLISAIEVPGHADNDQKFSGKECTDKGVTTDNDASERNATEGTGVEEQVIAADEFGLHGEQELAAFKEVTDSEQPNAGEDKVINGGSVESGSSSIVQQPSYELPPEDEGVFSVPDLVWGKVKSHPWWPGQIFDFTDASEKAMKHHKKDCYLVAYFGDRTFAWNEASTLKPFRTHFSQMEKQGNAETFQNAVNCALEEVSRRVGLGLACSCIQKDLCNRIKYQIVENAGIRLESNRREGVDESTSARFFQADKLIEYVKALAGSPSGGSDHLELVIAKAQLLAFCRFKGFSSLPEFQFCGDLVENDTAGPRFQDDVYPGEMIEHTSPLSKDDEQTASGQETLKAHNSSYHNKRKHNLRDSVHPKIKEKSLTELMGSAVDFPDDDVPSGKRRKGADNHDDLTAIDGRKTISVAKVSNVPKQSFKIGDCIRRVASQLTGSPTAKGNSERVQKLDGTSDRPVDGYDVSVQSSEGRVIDPTEYSSLDELLLQLQFIAQDPLKEYNFSNVIVNFFCDFRNSVVAGQQSGTEHVPVEKVGGKRKKVSPETFEFDDMNDTYWTDRVIQNGSEEQLPRRSRKKDQAASQPEKSLQEGRRPYSRKPRYSSNDHALTPVKPAESVNVNAPTQLIMSFSDFRSVPSEATLNKMFRRFGPLKEADTEVDRESSRARVVFKKGSDAEIAHSSAAKFNIFGPTLVNYELSYAPLDQFKPTPVAITQDHEMQLDLSGHDHEMHLHEMHLGLSAHDHEMHLDLSNLSEFEVNLV